MIRLVPAALLLALTLGAPSTARDRTTVPAAVPAGKARSCVSITSLRESRVRDDRVIDFMTGRDTAYRVTLPYACPGLGFAQAFSYETSIGQLCAQDLITVLHQAGGLQRGASCGLAEFQPVKLAERR